MTSTFVARRGILAVQPRPVEVEQSGTLPCLCLHATRLALTPFWNIQVTPSCVGLGGPMPRCLRRGRDVEEEVM